MFIIYSLVINVNCRVMYMKLFFFFINKIFRVFVCVCVSMSLVLVSIILVVFGDLGVYCLERLWLFFMIIGLCGLVEGFCFLFEIKVGRSCNFMFL